MPDLAERLRRWTHAADAAPASDLMDEAAAEIERLREAIRSLAGQGATLSVCNGAAMVTMDATLTDAERDAIEGAIIHMEARGVWAWPATLRGLLERTK